MLKIPIVQTDHSTDIVQRGLDVRNTCWKLKGQTSTGWEQSGLIVSSQASRL